MKSFTRAVYCAVLSFVALPVVAEVHVPGGTLADAVEALARQVGVDVLYPGNLLDGRRTDGVDGALSSTAAFGKLLEGTSLVVKEEGGALRIARAESPADAAIATAPAATVPEESECHRVTQSGRIQNYCGNTAQWKDLQARVGFRCRKEGKKGELCASATEWKRIDLAESTQRTLNQRYFYDEATSSVMQNHPVNNTIAPTVSAPLTTTTPAPTPTK